MQRFTYRSLIWQFVQSANSGMENHTAISVKNSPSYVKQAPRIHSQDSRKQLSPSYCFFFFYHATPAALGEFLWILHTTFHNVSALQLHVFWNSSAEAPAHLQCPAYWDWAFTIDWTNEERWETLTEWKEPLCSSQRPTAVHSHSVALILGKTGRLCVCGGMERRVDLWVREYFQPLCWMMN